MKSLSFVIFFLVAHAVCAADPVVSIRYVNSLRMPNRQIDVKIDDARLLTLQTQDKDGTEKRSQAKLKEEAFEELQKMLKNIEWEKVAKDKERGLDGASVWIVNGRASVKLWSPDYDMKRRGLERVQRLIEKVFFLASLDQTGMPQKKVN